MKFLTLQILVLVLSVIMYSCAPKVVTTVSKSYPTLSFNDNVAVYSLQENKPAQSEVIGVVKVSDSGFTIKCNYETVIEKAKLEARKMGGNALKIINHKKPDLISTCHRIEAEVLVCNETVLFPNITAKNISDSITVQNINSDLNYATFHIYRLSGMGMAVSYDLHLGDSSICRVKNN